MRTIHRADCGDHNPFLKTEEDKDDKYSSGKESGFVFASIDGRTQTGKMFISLLGTFAEYERKFIVSRVKKGMEKRAGEGKWNGGFMLGYDVVDKKLVINENEAEIVRKVFELRISGKGYKWITNYLNESGKKTKHNASFSTNTVKLKRFLKTRNTQGQ